MVHNKTQYLICIIYVVICKLLLFLEVIKMIHNSIFCMWYILKTKILLLMKKNKV